MISKKFIVEEIETFYEEYNGCNLDIDELVKKLIDFILKKIDFIVKDQDQVVQLVIQQFMEETKTYQEIAKKQQFKDFRTKQIKTFYQNLEEQKLITQRRKDFIVKEIKTFYQEYRKYNNLDLNDNDELIRKLIDYLNN